jgi:hypothetical protein
MIVPLNEQGMVMEGERIQIASEEHFTSINHSFDGSTLRKTSLGRSTGGLGGSNPPIADATMEVWGG